MSGLFSRGGKKQEDRERKEQARREAMQRFEPMVQEALTRLYPWAFPYGRVEGWEIIHVSPEGKRVVDVRVELGGEEGEWHFGVRVRKWLYEEIEMGHYQLPVTPTPVGLYDALRRGSTAG